MSVKIPFLRYGGKSTLAKWIISYFPEHRVYMEPFCGSCSVLLAKKPSFIEFVNDTDDELINVFRTLRSRPEELAALLWATPYSKSNWRDTPVTEDVMERARLAIAESKQFYCGADSHTWSVDGCASPHKPKSSVWSDWFLRVLPAAARLKDVQILNEDAIKAIKRVYQDSEALIYVDPPYAGHENEYKMKVDYLSLVAALNEAKAKVIVSEYSSGEAFFQGWRKEIKETANRAQTGRHKTAGNKKTEILFMNF
jgi:DNA adenine methylase